MWLFSNKPKRSCRPLAGFVDYHSHLLPRMDDGVRTIDEALQTLQFYEEQGVEAVWITPHIMEDMPNTVVHLQKCFTELCVAYTGTITLRLSAENMLDSLFEQRLQNNEVLPFGESGDCLLVETSYFNAPLGFHNTLSRIQSKGYHPVLAHPERYLYMDHSDYKQLKEMGIKFQLNILSPLGYYGKDAKAKALWLLKHSMYDMKGSDLHRLEAFTEAITKNAKKINHIISL